VNDQSQPNHAWHALDLLSLEQSLDATPSGLSASEAAVRLERFGPNVLPHTPPPTWWQIGLRQFRSPLIYILGVAALVSVAIGEATDAAFIAAVLGLNALIGGYQEWRAEKSTQALQQLLQIRAAVLRDGDVSEVEAEIVVPGDTVSLESGNRVPADLRIVSAHGLEIDESLLTGESLAVSKDPTWIGDAPTPIGDRRNMAFAGSIIVRGRAQGMVVATGPATHVGQLALDVLSTSGGNPPLLELQRPRDVSLRGRVGGVGHSGRTAGRLDGRLVDRDCADGTPRCDRSPACRRRGLGELHADRERQDGHIDLQ